MTGRYSIPRGDIGVFSYQMLRAHLLWNFARLSWSRESICIDFRRPLFVAGSDHARATGANVKSEGVAVHEDRGCSGGGRTDSERCDLDDWRFHGRWQP